MKIQSIILTVVAMTATVSRAELTEKTVVTDRGVRGLGEKVEVSRDGVVVYARLRLDGDRDGTYENHIEKFSVSGQVVLSLTFVGGSRGSITHSVKDAQVILSSETDSWRPDSILVQIRDSDLEYFTLQSDGFYRPASDDEKKRVATILATSDGMMVAAFRGDTKQVVKDIKSLQEVSAPQTPNKAPEPTPTSVTPRATERPSK